MLTLFKKIFFIVVFTVFLAFFAASWLVKEFPPTLDSLRILSEELWRIRTNFPKEKTNNSDSRVRKEVKNENRMVSPVVAMKDILSEIETQKGVHDQGLAYDHPPEAPIDGRSMNSIQIKIVEFENRIHDLEKRVEQLEIQKRRR
ncbi:MAG: hypothetical protein N2578_01780 [Bdellovibrionaceae bacterium]|nr:hypothetical protein [Pseudobdellovibrionaceae bacterium]